MSALPHTENPRLARLALIGDQQDFIDWPDYLTAYDFSDEDIPGLISILEASDYDDLSDKDQTAWTPMHAWRVLGQLRARQAIKVIISNLHRFARHESGVAELSSVMGLIGPEALNDLESYWSSDTEGEFERVIVLDSFFEILERNPEQYSRVMEISRIYLDDPIEKYTVLNALLVAHLIDHDAADLIDAIRNLFEKECVDITCCGDIEDVEIEFGLRDKRETPSIFNSEPSDAEEIEYLDDEPEEVYAYNEPAEVLELLNEVMLEYGDDDSICDISELDGYFAAILCAPELIMPGTWFPKIWSDGDFIPEWPDQNSFEKISNIIFGIYNTIAEDLNNDNYEPVFLEYYDGEHTSIIANSWADGFYRGLSLWEELSPEEAKVLDVCLAPVNQFATDESLEDTEAMPREKAKAVRDEIGPAVMRLHSHFFQFRKRPNTTFVHAQPKVGRNDACPCGSGKKYKKCCGLN